MNRVVIAGLLALGLLACPSFASAQDKNNVPPEGFKALFNGMDLANWKVPEGDNGHWKVVKGVIDYDAKSEAKGDKSLWTKDSFGDFILLVDWRLKKEPGLKHKVPQILPNGSNEKTKDGKEVMIEIDDVDSGVYLRGSAKSQINIWMWPIGSGEVYGYRTDMKQPPEVRKGVTPKVNADRPRGDWNTFEIKMVKDRLWVKNNGVDVITNAQLPGVAAEGPLALQHHGAWNAEKKAWSGPPSLVQFRNIYIKELK